MKNLEPMKVAMHDFTEEFEAQRAAALLKDDDDFPEDTDWRTNQHGSDWNLLEDNAPFSHKEACEFIVYTKHPDDYYTDIGYSTELIAIVKQAKAEDFAYVCFYA